MSEAGLFPCVRLIEAPGAPYPAGERLVAAISSQHEMDQHEKRHSRSTHSATTSRTRLKSVDNFRSNPRYGGGATREDLAYAIYALAHGADIDVLVIDDCAMAPLAENERRDFWEICEDRYQTRSFILASQLPVSRWHEQIGDPTVADGILDRLVHNAHCIELRGESIRKLRGTKTE